MHRGMGVGKENSALCFPALPFGLRIHVPST
jgi:hypothetical protein